MPRRTVILRTLAVSGSIVILGAGAVAAAPAVRTAGPKPDGTAVIPIGYRVTPAGEQSRLGDLPLSAVPFPDGRAVLVVDAGQAVQSLQVVDPASGAVLQRIDYRSPEALFVGVAFSPDGSKAYVSGGGNNKIR